MHLTLSASLACLLLASLAPAQVGTTYIVDVQGGPGVDFTSLGTAAASVPDGSTLVVRELGFEDLLIDGKSLTILGEGPLEFVDLQSSSAPQVRNLTAGQQVVVRGIRFTGDAQGAGFSPQVHDCAGLVWFEQCQLLSTWGGPGLDVANSQQVVLVDCVLRGGRELDGPPLVALDVRQASRVHAFDSRLEGVWVNFFGCFPKHGVEVSGSSFLYAQDCTLTSGECPGFPPPGVPALVLDEGSEANLRECVFEVGPVGTPNVDPCGTCSILEWSVSARRVDTGDDLLTAGLPAQVSIEGLPGETALLVFSSSSPAALALPEYLSCAVAQLPLQVVGMFQLSAAGALDLNFTPGLPPGVEHSLSFLQTVHLGTAQEPGIRASTPATLQVLAPGT